MLLKYFPEILVAIVVVAFVSVIVLGFCVPMVKQNMRECVCLEEGSPKGTD